MSKLRVQVCLGTACVVLGGLDPQTLCDMLPSELKDLVEVAGSTCLSFCKDKNLGKPPFVMINEDVIERASLEKVLVEIRKRLGRE